MSIKVKNVITVLFLVSIFNASLFAEIGQTAFKKVPEFSFVDQRGQSVTNSNLIGKIWVANFVFTRCQEMCPLLSGWMADVQKKLNSENIKLISFSVDPEHDTPDVLSEYAKTHGAISGKWFFVTADKNEKMWDFVSKGFMLGVGEATAEELSQGAEPVMHSSRFVLVDQNGNIRGYYDSQEPVEMERLVKDALLLLPVQGGLS